MMLMVNGAHLHHSVEVKKVFFFLAVKLTYCIMLHPQQNVL